MRSRVVAVVTSLLAGLIVAGAPSLTGVGLTSALATTACSGPGDFGAQYLSSSWPGGFTGVPVYSDGGGAVTNCYNYVTSPVTGTSVQSGMEWQCVELVNRLYLAKGWITSTWHGNGNQMYANAPASLAKQPQGSITYLAPGDVISFNSTSIAEGHVAVVAQVSGSSITLVNQNTASSSTLSYATISGGTLTDDGLEGIHRHRGCSCAWRWWGHLVG